MTAELTVDLRPVPAPMVTVIRAPKVHWMITVGTPPYALAVCVDIDIAERIQTLLDTYGLVDVGEVLDTTQENQ